MEYFLLIIGFILLIKGAVFFVDGSSSLAGILKIPSIIIGLTIVAMGTSAPEASVSISASLGGQNDIAVSNIIGSNIFNGLIVVGVCAIISHISVNKSVIKRDLPLCIIISIILLLMSLDGKLSFAEGIILLIGMILYIICMIITALKNRTEEENIKILSLPRSIIYIAGGLVAVVVGGDMVVDNACIIARNFSISESFIGLTIVAIGTSLPELVTSISATKKGDLSLAIGNAIGSNIFNILFILGASASLSPLSINKASLTDCIVLIISSVMLFVFAYTGKKISKPEGIICVLLYVSYSAYLLIKLF